LEDAVRVYRQLAESRPDDMSIQDRIADLQRKLDDAEPEEQPAPVWEDEAAVPAAQFEDVAGADAADAPAVGFDAGFRFVRQAPRDGLVEADPFAGSFDLAMAGGAVEGPDAEVAPVEGASVSEFASPTDDLEALAAELEGAEPAIEPAVEPEPTPSTLEPPAADLDVPALESGVLGFEEEDLAADADVPESDVADIEPQSELPIAELGVPESASEAEPEFEPAAAQFKPPAEDFEPPAEEFEPPTDEFVPPTGVFEPPVSEPERASESELSAFEEEPAGFEQEPAGQEPELPIEEMKASSDLEALAAELEGSSWESPDSGREDDSGESEPSAPEPEEAGLEIDAPAAELDAILSDAGDLVEGIEPVGAATEYREETEQGPIEPDYEPPPEFEASATEPEAVAEEDEEVVSEEPAPSDAVAAFSTDALVSDEDLWAPRAESPAIAEVADSEEGSASHAEAIESRETVESHKTIEGYLAGLLDFSPNVRPDSPSGPDVDEGVPSVEGSGRESSEDLARFQEWLRGLKR
jgi:hypothetical protein